MNIDRFEEYLETILYLIRKNKGPAKTKQISEELNVSPPSVTEMIKKLYSSGLVEYTPYQGVELTEKGTDQAIKIKRKHQVLETFLVDVLDFDRKEAHKEACELEHAVSDAVLERLYEFLGSPEYCPDGNPINLDKNNITQDEKFIPLDEMEEGSSGKVARVTLPRETKERLISLGILTGEDIEVRRKQKQGCISVMAIGSEIALGRDIAKKIFISPKSKNV
ncbi:MAG: DtxR family transcriptional regulator [Methanosarcina flavescens]|uniref:Metal-dependent transcriptional regulator n=1 Tax=Methanosarcina flavescens TaxID=1715806 RepID=A0A660HRZ3_9EURY|nr:metal-dependent transcriptional regulator [Methanosarcina flavescens]AYK15013.1 metal-dependent transcriptional regulator [Methanosarcina flavescens]NLK31579.1 metal-dependent transcriptional regulator [Methanosarcina flavescens]